MQLSARSAVIELLLFTHCPHPISACSPKTFSRCKAWHHPNFIICEKDLDGRLVRTNQIAAKVLGYNATEDDRIPHDAYMAPEYVEYARERDKGIVETGRPILGQHRYVELLSGGAGWIVQDTLLGLNDAGEERLYDIARILTADTETLKRLGLTEIPLSSGIEVGDDVKQCKMCGMPYEQRRRWQKYCSGNCRQLAFWQRQRHLS